MNKIEYGPKLDFSNVLIRPKRSTINSRSEVDLNRTFKFKYSSYDWTGVPIISANMDTTGTFQVHESLRKHNIITALHKFYNKDDYLQQNNETITTNTSKEITTSDKKWSALFQPSLKSG